MKEPIIDKDGYYYYECTECTKVKLAALFTPSELIENFVCRSCRGDLNAKRYTPDKSKPKTYGGPLQHTFANTDPMPRFANSGPAMRRHRLTPE